MTADGNCFYRAVAHIVIDLGVRSVGYRHSDVRRDLADTLDTHRDESLDGGIALASAALLATHDTCYVLTCRVTSQTRKKTN